MSEPIDLTDYKCPGCETSQADLLAFEEKGHSMALYQGANQDGGRAPVGMRQEHDVLGQLMLKRRQCQHPEHDAPIVAPPPPLPDDVMSLIEEARAIQEEAAAESYPLDLDEAIRIVLRRRDYEAAAASIEDEPEAGEPQKSGSETGATEPVHGDAPQETHDGTPDADAPEGPAQTQEEGPEETVPVPAEGSEEAEGSGTAALPAV